MSKTTFQTLWNFLQMLPVTVARSFSDDNAIRYVLPVLWMTSYFHIMGLKGQNQRRRYVWLSLPDFETKVLGFQSTRVHAVSKDLSVGLEAKVLAQIYRKYSQISIFESRLCTAWHCACVQFISAKLASAWMPANSDTTVVVHKSASMWA